ncbi:MAG: hypothetical protein WD751_01530 [Anaerolineales bacterium]
MALGSLLMLLALLILVAVFVARPLVEGREEPEAADSHSSRLIAERERILEALTELDTDWQMGKVPAEIYTAQREQLVAKGAEALEELDKVANNPKGKQATAKRDDELEALIAAYKAKGKAGK